MGKISLVSKHYRVNNLFDKATKAAQFPVSVLILGESGTGKEVLAQYIFDRQQELSNSGGKFVDINCSALPEELLESELFGHKKGAFTGAYTNKKGLFIVATGGAIFLDEIGDMPILLQSKLLRCLETQTIRPVGATQAVNFNTRVISATNQNLHELISNKSFRADLLYRLNGITLETIPLRHRPRDIPGLFSMILQDTINKFRLEVQATDIPVGIIETLSTYKWPGNIRELKNVIESLVILSYEHSKLVFNPQVLSDLLESYSKCIYKPTNQFVWSVDKDGTNLKTAVTALETYIISTLTERYGSLYKAASKAGVAYATARKKCTQILDI